MVGLAIDAAIGFTAESLKLQGAVSYWGPRAPVIAAMAALATLLWSTRLKTLVALATKALNILWLAVAFTPVTS